LDPSIAYDIMQTNQLRRNDVLATNLLFGALAIGTVIMFLRVAVFKADNPFLGTKHIGSAVIITSWVIGYALTIGLYYAVRLGKRWARTLLLISFVLNIVFAIFYHDKLVRSLHTDLLYVLNYIVGYAIQIWALVLLFRKPQAALA
jgi:hypothetical protein